MEPILILVSVSKIRELVIEVELLIIPSFSLQIMAVVLLHDSPHSLEQVIILVLVGDDAQLE